MNTLSPIFSQVFGQNQLTLGLIAPFMGYQNHIPDNLTTIADNARLAENLGFSALWVRDVPFYDPHFGDVGQGLDPMVTLGFLSAHTQNIALGTAGLIAPLRSPIHIAKMATSVDSLSHGRFLLGLSSGDRPVEYPAFGADFASRSERFRESIDLINTLTEQDFPHFKGKHYADLTDNLDLLPKPKHRLPIVAIGRARQEMDWLANVPDAWIWHGVNPADTANIINTLADLRQKDTPTAFVYAQFVEVLDDKNAKAQLFNNIYLRGGAKGLADFWAKEQEKGVKHLALNLKPTQRPADEVLTELAEYALTQF